MNIEELMNDISRHREIDKVVFFVGAGVSQISKYPSWAELVAVMADKLSYAYKSEGGKPQFTSDEYLHIPQMFYDNHSKKEYLNLVNKQFENNCEINRVHELIMSLNPRHIITTNYDTLLEQSSNKYGINYSIINADDKVSETPTQRYILKVHGDFEKNEFVLKEEDYINYENKFKLIDNVLKTIMATNLIIFIGYSLSDYNIRLILNWVKQVQGKTFIEPIFIYTGKYKLERTKIKYYEKRRIRIFDTNLFIDSDSYEDKYIKALSMIIDYNKAVSLRTDIEKIDFLYTQLKELKAFKYIRTTELAKIFEQNYKLLDNNYLTNLNRDADYIETFYRLKNDFSAQPDTVRKLSIIDDVLQKGNIRGYINKHDRGIFVDDSEKEIQNEIFQGKLKYAEEYIGNSYNSIPELYDSAYFNYAVGNLYESYSMYTELLKITKENNEWLYYYCCQVNRRFVYKTIIELHNFLTIGSGVLSFPRLRLFDDVTINVLKSEMANFRFEELYYELPANIRKKYRFLKRLCSQNIYKDQIISFVEMEYKIKQDISNNTVTIFGYATYEKLKAELIDVIKFTYDNKLLFTDFSEHKHYVRNVMSSYLKGQADRMKYDNPNYGNPKYKITFQEVLLLVKNLKAKEIAVLENDIDIKAFQFDDTNRFEDYIIDVVSYYEQYFADKIQGTKIQMYFIKKEEYKSISYIAHYFIKSQPLLDRLINFILNILPEREIDSAEKLIDITKLINQGELTYSIKTSIDNFVYNRIRSYIETPNLFSIDAIGRDILYEYFKLIYNQEPDYKSAKLSSLCNRNLSSDLKQFLLKFEKLISNEARRLLE